MPRATAALSPLRDEQASRLTLTACSLRTTSTHARREHAQVETLLLDSAPPSCMRASCGPSGDSRNNPCRRQGDQVVAPSATGRRLLVQDDHGASRGRRYRAARLRGGRRRRPVVLSRGARPRMGVPVAEGSARPRSRRSRDGRPRAWFAPAFARGCGRPHTPGRRARVSSLARASPQPVGEA
jgi:hypothetical protein